MADEGMLSTLSAAKKKIEDSIRSMQIYHRNLCDEQNEYSSSLRQRQMQHAILSDAYDFFYCEKTKINHMLYNDFNEIELNS